MTLMEFEDIVNEIGFSLQGFLIHCLVDVGGIQEGIITENIEMSVDDFERLRLELIDYMYNEHRYYHIK